MYTCEYCGKQFYESRLHRTRPPRFCSYQCRLENNKKYVECPQCHQVFVTRKSSKRKFCSQTCSNRFNQPMVGKSVFKCQWCGKDFEEWTYRHPTFCSNQCRSEYACRIRAKQLYKGGPISRGLNWKRQSRLARKRDNYTCQICGKSKKRDGVMIGVHHIKPYREFDGDYEKANDLNNLITLCYSCHPKVEMGIITIP